MPLYTPESLDNLRQRIDLVEVLESHIELKRAGGAYKALCPFHDEKTPSFTVQKGDRHYHCFGCGAHGDAIQFLMEFQKLNFSEAIESLANRFHVHLEQMDKALEPQGPSRAKMKEALEIASHFFQLILLKTEEGHAALEYLFGRGIDLDFIKHFRIGYAPKQKGPFLKAMRSKKVSEDILVAAGLMRESQNGELYDFFSERITFPIHEPSGSIIGFSARKIREQVYGGKYINTPETPLFKKSRVLFGLNYSRRRIAKEKKAIIVEGQVDALKLIQAGFDITVAGQGTAFGEGHVREMTHLGVQEVFLALDADDAGQAAAYKIGDLFQKCGVEVKVVNIPPGLDPDAYLHQEGAEAFMQLLQKSTSYLPFIVQYKGRYTDGNSAAGKTVLVDELSKQIRGWDNPLMVHESLRQLAHLLQVPEEILRVEVTHNPHLMPRQSSARRSPIMHDPNQILEADLIRWILLMKKSKPHFLDLAKEIIRPEDLVVPVCRAVYETLLAGTSDWDLLSLSLSVADPSAQEFLSEILNKKVDKEKADSLFFQTIDKISTRNWMERREVIRQKLQSGALTDEEAMDLAKQFDNLKKNPPQLLS